MLPCGKFLNHAAVSSCCFIFCSPLHDSLEHVLYNVYKQPVNMRKPELQNCLLKTAKRQVPSRE